MVGLQSMWVDGCCGAKANKHRPPSKIADEWARNWVNRKFNILRWQPTKASLVHTIPLIVLRSSTNLLQLTTAEWRVHIGVTWRWIGSFNLPTTNLFEDELCFTCNTIIQYGSYRFFFWVGDFFWIQFGYSWWSNSLRIVSMTVKIKIIHIDSHMESSNSSFWSGKIFPFPPRGEHLVSLMVSLRLSLRLGHLQRQIRLPTRRILMAQI